MIQKLFRAANIITDFISIASVLSSINSFTLQIKIIWQKWQKAKDATHLQYKISATKEDNYFIVPSAIPLFIYKMYNM